MLTRSLDNLIHATQALPDDLIALERSFGHHPQALAAFKDLHAALADVRRALDPGRGPRPEAPSERSSAA
jgi:hypothetical protein